MQTNGRGDTSVVNAVFLGAALGAVGALLLAPKSGRKLRRDIARQGTRMRRRGEDFKVRAGDTMDDWVERGNAALETAKDAVEEARQIVRGATRAASR